MRPILAAVAIGLCFAGRSAYADEFTKTDVDRWQKEYQEVVAQGRGLWTDGALGTNGVA